MTEDVASSELVEVRLLRLPVAVWNRSQEHADELIREFTLIAASPRVDHSHDVPARLTDLIEQLTSQYAGFTGEQEVALAAAAAAGVEEIELTFRVPATAADAADRVGAMLDAADDYCRAGQHLLTLATPPEALAFRQWYLGEFSRQVAGQPPTTWPGWLADRSTA
jgi:hypothetical protein